MKDFKGMPALDAGLLASAQAVEHYEISRYGTLSTWAEELGYEEAVSLLEATLQEEKNTDKTLTGIAKSVVNVEAEQTRPTTSNLGERRLLVTEKKRNRAALVHGGPMVSYHRLFLLGALFDSIGHSGDRHEAPGYLVEQHVRVFLFGQRLRQ